MPNLAESVAILDNSLGLANGDGQYRIILVLQIRLFEFVDMIFSPLVKHC
jgi:hypothetical protein